MILCLDAGNSSVTAGCVEEGFLISRAMFSAERRTADEYAVLLSQAFELRGVKTEEFDGAVIACVVPALTEALREAASRLTGREALVVGAGVKTGLNIGLDNPSELGADLVAAAVGALDRVSPPLIVADLGTATSVVVIDARSRLLGGAILPGAAVSLEALAGTASLLPSIPLEAPRRCIGTNTNACMKSGAIFGTASAIDGMIDRFEAELGQSAAHIATGALAPKIIPHCRHKMTIDDALTMRGLYKIWEKNLRPARRA